MDSKKMGNTWYIRLDRGDQLVSSLMGLCEKEGIGSAVFTGIGGCGTADLQTFIPETGMFETQHLEGTLELINVTGNIVSDEDGSLFHHTHAILSFKKDGRHEIAAGHVKEMVVLYTAEIELRPVQGVIHRNYDPETGTGFWAF